jgi:hypothetical protein
VKKMEWMVAAGTVAAIAGAVYSAGCVNTHSDCALLGTCGAGGGTSSTSTSVSSTGAGGGTSSTSTSASSTGVGGMAPISVCESRHYGDAKDQAARSIHVDTAGNVLFAGEFQGKLSIGGMSATAVGKDVFVAKVNSLWEVQWLKQFAVSYGAIAYDLSGSIILAGAYANVVDFGCATPLAATDNLYVVKLDAGGSCTWAKGFNAPGANVRLAVDDAGQIALAGDSAGVVDFHDSDAGPLAVTGGIGGGRDIFAATLDKDGNVLSAVAYGGTADDMVNAVAADAAGGMIIAGSFKSATLDFVTGKNPPANKGTLEQAFVARIKGTGASWALGFPGDGAQQATAVAVVKNVPIVAGHFTKTMNVGNAEMLTATGDDLFLIGIDVSTTTVAWKKAFNGTGAKTIGDLATSGTDTLALTGSIDGDVDFGLGALTSKKGVYFAKLASADGKAHSSHAFGDMDPALAAGGVALDGSGVYVAGSFGAPLDLGDKMPLQSTGGADVFVAKFCLP